MAQHVISGFALNVPGGWMEKFVVDGVSWSRRRLCLAARAGDTFVTNSATPLPVAFQSLANPTVLSTSDVAVPTKDGITGVSATAIGNP